MIWVGALVLLGYWILFNALTALLLSWLPAPGATVPSFSQVSRRFPTLPLPTPHLRTHTVPFPPFL